ncbi:hypothetical protein [Kitasatospora sp. LaBMicrA B282]|uniref:hypothetical protein n=1 Tax=Kitasatospora sp. LaBMicrA B282 TaxID=3420949 RepID=UPI003D144B54
MNPQPEQRARPEPQELTERLVALATAPAPRSTVSAEAAIRAGRTRQVRRRLAVLGAVTAVAVATGGVVAALPEARHPAPAATDTAAGPATDPLVVPATFGWLPDVLEGVSYQSGNGPNGLGFARASGKPVPGPDMTREGLGLWLQVYQPGQVPVVGPTSAGQLQYQVPAAPVNGEPAYWLAPSPDSPTGADTFRWQAADGRWVELTVDKPEWFTQSQHDQVVAVLPRIAAGVRVADQALPLPFRITGLSQRLRPVQQETTWNEHWADVQAWRGSFDFRVAGTQDVIGVTVGPEPYYPGSDPGQVPNSPTEVSSCLRGNGLRLCADSQQGLAAFAPVGGVQAFLQKVQLLGIDPEGWTADVLAG